jgi:hypothetical protein
MNKLLITFFLLILSHSVSASSSSFLSKVDSVYPLGSGTVIITFQTPSSECEDPNGHFRLTNGQNSMTPEGIKNILSVSLTAAVADKNVWVVFDPSTSKCYIERLKVNF